MSGAERPGRAARIGGYFGRRIGNPFISRVGRDTIADGADQAGRVVRRIDRFKERLCPAA